MNNTPQNSPAAEESLIAFFCRDCQKIVKAEKINNKYNYKCPLCHGKDIPFGTQKSIKNFFHIKE